jgi:ATP-dependent RNA helicase DOB1
VEGINPEFMLERSFYQFQHYSTIPALHESKKFVLIESYGEKKHFPLELKNCEQQYESIKIENEEEVARYYKLKKKLELVQEQMSLMMNEPKYLLPFLQPGRLVTVCYLHNQILSFRMIFDYNFVRKLQSTSEDMISFNFLHI